jgi:RNA polymerase sigma-70 factor (ECF subfamily)
MKRLQFTLNAVHKEMRRAFTMSYDRNDAMNIKRVSAREKKLAEDYSSLDEVMGNYTDTVYRIAFTYTKNVSDASDITQEVFLKFFEGNKRFESEEHIKAWLIRVAVNASKKLLRSAWFRKTVSLSNRREEGCEDQNFTEVYDAILSLPDKYRPVIHMYYFEDYPVKDIARTLGRNEAAVQTQLRRARALLKEKLKEEWQDE